MDALVAWLQATSLSHFIVFQIWVWPLCETIHFVGMALLIGLVGFFDLRLMGFFRQVSIAAARELMPFALYGFAMNLTTGAIFLIGHPEQYVHNPAWWWKVACLVIAGANAAVFEWTTAKRVVFLGAHEDTPLSAKLMGAISLASWLGVLVWGRMLPFVGAAF